MESFKFENQNIEEGNKIEETPAKNITSKSGLGRKIKKIAALGGVMSLGFFGSTDSAEARDKNPHEGENNKPKTESYQKGRSLGQFYVNKFKQADKEKELYKSNLEIAKKILQEKGVEYDKNDEISINMEENELSEILINGISVLVINVENSSPVNEKSPKDGVENKTVVSDSASDFL